jgi:FtsP/CotA-like multicopper oxidase with cupredoxin domain
MLNRRRLLTIAGAAMIGAPGSGGAVPEAITTLALRRRIIEVNGKAASVYGIYRNDQLVPFVTDVSRGFNVRVQNELDEPSLIHWHGLTPPARLDGVPGISGPAIPPKGEASYRFDLPFSGTYWMHSHYGLQEQQLMTAPLIIRQAGKYENLQEIIVLLSDFSFRTPEEIFGALTGKQSKTPRDMAHDHEMHEGMDMAMDHEGSGTMSMPDLNDVVYDAFLANDRTLADPAVFRVERGGRILLRLINGAAMSAFHVDLSRLAAKLVAVDGQDILPMTGNRFPIAQGQRLDLLLELPKENRAWPILFVLEGERRQTGVVLAPPNASVTRLPEEAATAFGAIALDLETNLRAAWPLTPRESDRRIPIELTGSMADYVWTINNVVWTPSTAPFPVRQGERVEIVMTNKTMMSHPMHLHGHRFQVVEINGARMSGALRDTVLVPPRSRVAIAFDADNPGLWAFHCHSAYHMHAGMFATLKYD